MNADVLGRLKPGAMFINTARAEVVDYDALDAAVRDRGLRIGLDVFRNEPASGTGHYERPAGAGGWRVRHSPHRRLD